ncbi:MAG: hypothetical protein JSS86_25725 [Cyanobacteria bacterium SZAS LIN-2]|nr:hypothetical protein [Cyanobacteria bacterium SZAS LIN-2]
MNATFINTVRSSYIFGQMQDTDCGDVDGHFRTLSEHLRRAEEAANQAKRCLFAVKSHHGTYEKIVRLPRNKRLQAIVEKHSNLQVNYDVADHIFRCFANLALEASKKLSEFMPRLIELSLQQARDSNIQRARRNNAVVCSQLIKATPDLIDAMHQEFKPEDIMLIACGGSVMCTLRLYVCDESADQKYTGALNVPYVRGLFDYPAVVEMEASLAALQHAAAVCKARYQTFMEVRSRAMNLGSVDADLTTIKNPDDARAVVQKIDDETIAYELARHALEMARSELFHAQRHCRQALKAAHEDRGNTSMAPYLRVVADSNLVSVRCEIVAADEVRMATRFPDDRTKPQCHELCTKSYSAVETAFEGIPAKFPARFLNYLVVN